MPQPPWLAAAFTSPTRPEEIKTDGLYGQGVETVDTMTLGNISWQEMFTDPYLQQLIQQGLDNNTDLQSAYWRVKEAEATLKSARLAYLPSFNFAPNGGVSSLTNPWNATWTYTVPVTASWEVDIFGKLTNSKRRAKLFSRKARSTSRPSARKSSLRSPTSITRC